MQGQSCCQTGTPSFSGNKIYVRKRADNDQGSYASVSLCGTVLQVQNEQQGFTDAATANKNGLVGILANKLLGKLFNGAPKSYEIDCQNVTKLEIIPVKAPMMGTIYNAMFWEVPAAQANYENYFCVLSLSDAQQQTFLAAVKKVLPNLEIVTKDMMKVG